jgi:hypothetical protein
MSLTDEIYNSYRPLFKTAETLRQGHCNDANLSTNVITSHDQNVLGGDMSKSPDKRKLNHAAPRNGVKDKNRSQDRQLLSLVFPPLFN